MSEPVAPFAAFGHRSFTLFQAARFVSVVGIQMQGVAIAWQVYALTNDPMALAYVGLAQFLPAFVLPLATGALADRYSRKGIVALCHVGYSVCALALMQIASVPNPDVRLVYACLIGLGVARAFHGPAGSALMPSLVPDAHFPNAAAWGSTVWQAATIAGPALGGFVNALPGGSVLVYRTTAALELAALLLLLLVRAPTTPPRTNEPIFERLSAGVRYVWRNQLLLGAISLDLFAVLLGGAVALMPIFARDVLHTDSTGLGLLRAAPSAGAAVVALWIAFHPLERRAGRAMFVCVAGFGLATIVFGISRWFPLSLLALALVGATDMVSVVVRSTLVQLRTPPEMRGRVSAVNLVFVGASNELGEYESGLTAKWFGAVRAVVLGGVGTLVVTGVWALLFPALRDVDRLVERAPDDAG